MSGLGRHGARLHAHMQPCVDGCIVALTGELDLVAAGSLVELFSAVLAGPGLDRVEVDVAQVSFLDLAGVRALLRAHELATEQGVLLCVRNPQPHIAWLLQATGAAEQLLTHPDAEPVGAAALDVSASPRGGSVTDERERRVDERERRAADRDLLDAERARWMQERARQLSEHERWQNVREDLANLREQQYLARRPPLEPGA